MTEHTTETRSEETRSEESADRTAAEAEAERAEDERSEERSAEEREEAEREGRFVGQGGAESPEADDDEPGDDDEPAEDDELAEDRDTGQEAGEEQATSRASEPATATAERMDAEPTDAEPLDADTTAEPATAAPTAAPPADGLEPLLPASESSDFRTRWEEVQVGFVDQPREAVEQADELVESLMARLSTSFSERREQLEEQWSGGGEASTEDLRLALQRYRSFFDRLLHA